MPAVTRAQKITFGEMRSPDLLRGLSLQPFVRDQRHRSPRTPEERISPKVIFCGRAGMPHDSADRAGSEAYSLGLGRPCALGVQDSDDDANDRCHECR
jgi:hypothetical protein